MCFKTFLFKNSMASGTTKPSKPTKLQRAKVGSFAYALTKKGIRLLAVDFDRTIIDIHSRGVWDEGVNKLASHVRPCMKDLLEAATQRGVYVAIVTYHRQDWLIKELLEKVLPKKVAKQIYVQANTPEFMQQQRQKAAAAEAGEVDGAGSRVGGMWAACPDFNGKEAHIAEVIAQIANDHKVTLKKHEVLLMDDDIDNIRTAITCGHLAFQVQQNVDYDSFDSFQTMLLL